LYLPKTVII